MKRFKAAAQRATAFVLAASMMSSAVLPTVFAAQPLNAENSVDELGNVDVADEDGTLVYPEWDDDTAADFQDEGDTIDLSDAEFDSDGDGQIEMYGGFSDTLNKAKKIYDNIKKAAETLTANLAAAVKDAQDNSQMYIDKEYGNDHTPNADYELPCAKLEDEQKATCTTDGYRIYKCTRTMPYTVTASVDNPVYDDYSGLSERVKTALQGLIDKSGSDTIKKIGEHLGDEELSLSMDITLTCNHEPIKVIIPHTGNEHQWGEEHTKEATCEEDGKTFQVCEICHTEKILATTPKLNHDFQNYVKDDNPACQDQTETGTCTRTGCGKTDTRTISGPLSPHKFTTWTGTGISVSGQYLYYKSTCDTCHTAEKEINIADKKLDELDEALNGDPLTATDKELENIGILYNGAKAAIEVLGYANKYLGTSFDTEKYTERLNGMTDRYNKF